MPRAASSEQHGGRLGQPSHRFVIVHQIDQALAAAGLVGSAESVASGSYRIHLDDEVDARRLVDLLTAPR